MSTAAVALTAAAAALRQLAEAVDAIAAQPVATRPPVQPAVTTWRERLWTCDPQVRIGVPELSEEGGPIAVDWEDARKQLVADLQRRLQLRPPGREPSTPPPEPRGVASAAL